MGKLITALAANALTTMLVAIAVFVCLVYLFARNDSLAFARGLLRVIASAISSPVTYLQRTIKALAAYGSGRDAAEDTDQYLLNRLMTILQAIVVVATFAALTAGLIAAWNDLVPPAEIRTSYREAQKSLEASKAELATATANVQRLDSEWTSQEQEAVRRARAPEEQGVRDASARMKNAEDAAAQFGGVAATAMSRLIARAGELGSFEAENEYALQRATSSLREIANEYWYSMSDEDRTLLGAWIEQWTARAAAQQRLAAITPAAVRAARQPSFADVSARKEAIAADVAEKESNASILKEASRLRFSSAAWTVAKTAVVCLVTIWFYGLMLEALWLVVRVAGDVKRIRASMRLAPDEAETRSPLPMSVTQLQPTPSNGGFPATPHPAAT